MLLNYIKSKSTISPAIIDSTSSKTTVYIRKEIVEKTREDEVSGEKVIYYEYLEAKLTKAEYQQYLAELSIIDIEKQRADIDYIALMNGISLE